MKYRAHMIIRFDLHIDADNDKQAVEFAKYMETMPGIALSRAYSEPACAWNHLTRVEEDVDEPGRAA